ncbi:MAG: methionyl-tRNA formyltransferase [Alphaproteobacteria bacterium]|nr:methionyl-tRNA formyltransferase [Alphaproteobacteria bacterium]
MRLVFMGTPDFSVPPLLSLIKTDYTIVGVYTQPPRPKNRGHHVTKSPVHEVAEAHGIPVYTPKTLRDNDQQGIFKTLNADIAVVVAYGLILPKAILEAPRKGCLNIHGSILPRWRGAAPIHRAMLAGDNLTGITIMQMDEGLDTGDMLSTSDYNLSPSDTFIKVHDDLSQLGADLLIKTLPDYMNDTIVPQKQPQEGITYAHKLTKEEGLLDFSQSAEMVLRQVKTLNPWPGPYTYYNGTLLKIKDASITADRIERDIIPGTLLENGSVVCGDGCILSFDILQREGGKPLPKNDFLRGMPLMCGKILGE